MTESETKFADTEVQGLMFPTFLKSDEPRAIITTAMPHKTHTPGRTPHLCTHYIIPAPPQPCFTGRTHIGRFRNLPLVVQLVKFWIPACWLQPVLRSRVKERRTKDGERHGHLLDEPASSRREKPRTGAKRSGFLCVLSLPWIRNMALLSSFPSLLKQGEWEDKSLS